MELLDVGVRAQVASDGCGLDELLVVVLAHRADTEKEVVEVGRGDHHPVDAEAYARTFCLDIVVDISGAEERVVEDFQTVVLVEHLAPLLTYLCGVGLGEDEADVVDEIVDLVASDTVVLFHALHDVVVHLVAHLLVSGFGENGDDEEHQEDDC